MAGIRDLKGYLDFPGGFRVLSESPIDPRFAGDSVEFLQSIIEAGAVYPGLKVFITNEQKYYIYKKDQEGNYRFIVEEILQPSGPSVELDTTLTQKGKAADAEAVGKALIKNIKDGEGLGSLVSGLNSLAKGDYSQAHGEGIVVESSNTIGIGKFNELEDTTNLALVLGDGSSNDSRSTSLRVYRNGRISSKTAPYISAERDNTSEYFVRVADVCGSTLRWLLETIDGVQTRKLNVRPAFLATALARRDSTFPLTANLMNQVVQAALTDPTTGTNLADWSEENQAKARTTLGAVGFTDIDRMYGIMQNADTNKLTFTPTNDNEKGLRNTWAWSKYRAVLLSDFDKLLRLGLVDNAVVLTDEEKASACEWLGAIPKNFSNIKSNYPRVFVSRLNDEGEYSNELVGMDYHNTANKNFIVVRTDGGSIYLPNAPQKPEDSVNKKYLDNLPDYLTLTEDQKAKWKAWLENILS